MKNKCKECDGKGYTNDGGTFSQDTKCEVCNGTGDVNFKFPLTFDKYREMNYGRCKADIKTSDNWTPLEWGGALAGEVGELCNFLKKMRRGEKIDKEKLAHELGDIICYADLLAAKLDIDLGKAVIEKFNIVSKRWGSKYTL